MTIRLRKLPWTQCRVQLNPDVRLRRESWGGLAFHRGQGELLELDQQAFDLLAALSHISDLRDLAITARGYARVPPRLPELCQFLRKLEHRGFVQQVQSSRGFDRRVEILREVAARPAEKFATNASRRRELSAPLVAHWAVTYRCNLSCAFCYVESSPQREREPAPEVRDRIVRRLAEWGVFEVALGGGEPTILPDFPELLAAIRRHGMVPNITSNGVLSSAKHLESLAKYAGIVHLSVDRPELLDAARGAGVSKQIKITARRLSELNIRWGVNLLLTPDNSNSLNRSLLELQDLGASAITLLQPKGTWAIQNWPGFPNPQELRSIAGSVKRFVKRKPALRLYVDTALRGKWSLAGLLDDPEPEVLGCGGGQRHVAITPDGNVYPCSHARCPDLRMGNLLKNELSSIWQSGCGRTARREYLQACRGTTCPCSAGQASNDR